MKKAPGIETNPAETITVLSVSPMDEDHISLTHIFKRIEWSVHATSRWLLHPTATLESALQLLRENVFPLVIAERDMLPGSWKDVLEAMRKLPKPPLLIVTSRLADDCLWAEALSLGAYDVMAKPFDIQEVVRVLSVAWLHWKNNPEIENCRTASM
jgi:DNA-binding response OmpR family regulator